MTPPEHHRNEESRNVRERATRRDLLASLSLANLCFLGVWIELSGTNFYYFRKTPPSGTMLVATVFCIFLLAMLMFGVVALIRRSGSARLRSLAKFAFLLFLLIPLNVARTSVAELSQMTDAVASSSSKLLAGFAILTVVVFALRRSDALVRTVTAGLLLLLPLFPLMAGQALWTYARRPPDAAFASVSPAVKAAGSARTRILWMLFDEWDYRLAFDKRPAGLILPEMDRLRHESFNATHAVGGGFGVRHAVPSLLSGHNILQERDSGPRELLVRPGGSNEFLKWSTQPTLFSRLRDEGWTTAVAGWFLPYCRVLGSQIDICEWEPGASIYDRPEYANRLSLIQSMRTLAGRVFTRIPRVSKALPFRKDIRQRELQINEYQRIQESARNILGRADFVFVHWPVPHPFGIYDRATGAIGPHTRATYFDNLALADRTVGQFRAILEARGEWDNTIVLISSDHSLRPEEWRYSPAWTAAEAEKTENRQFPYVPFVVKLAGQRKGRNYDQPFSILLTNDLLLGLARAEIKTAEDLVLWFDHNRGRFPLAPGL